MNPEQAPVIFVNKGGNYLLVFVSLVFPSMVKFRYARRRPGGRPLAGVVRWDIGVKTVVVNV
jgi:hypothetical protein